MKKLLFSAIFAIAIVNLSAQVVTRAVDSQTISNFTKLSEKAITKSYNLKKVDREKLLAEDEREKAAGLPFRFGHIFSPPLAWLYNPCGKVFVNGYFKSWNFQFRYSNTKTIIYQILMKPPTRGLGTNTIV